jgi:tetratricopeptide (TPR) repeat protein
VAIDELQVTGRTSSFTFKGRNDVDLKTIGQLLGVSNILEGSVRKSGNTVRITAQLTSAENGFHLWSNTYDRELTEIFEIQEEIASAIGEALQVELGLKVAQFLDRRRTDSPEAYEWNLRGDQLLRNTDVTSQKLAAEAFQKAIRLDQNYVPAYVGYAMTQTSLLAMGGGSVTELQQEAQQALDVVARLDPDYSRRYVVLGYLHQFLNDVVGAESSFKRALELDPEDLLAQSAWANYLYNLAGRPEEAIELYQRYRKREPMDAANLAMALASAGRIVEAEAELRHIIEIDPGYATGYDLLSDLYAYYMNRHAESLPLRRKAFEFNPEGVVLMNQTARTYLDIGDDAAAERWVREAERISDRAYWTIGAKFFLSYYRDDEKRSQSLSRQLADLAQVNRYGWWSTADLAWLRTLQGEDPDTALRVYKSLTPEMVADEPTVDSWSHAVAISLAALYLQTGNEALANELLDQSLAVLESADVHYNHPHKTAIYALKGDASRALEELRISIDANWRWEWWMLEKDPIYQSLWGEPEFDAMAIGSGGAYALSAARAMLENSEMDARDIVEKSMGIAADICVYTNHALTIESLQSSAER